MQDFDLEKLLQLLVVFLFLVLPALKGVRESQRAERERRRTPRPIQPRPRAPSGAPLETGLEDWKRLLRGEAPLSAPRPPPAPRPAPPAPPVPAREVSLEGRSIEGRSLETAAAGRSLEGRSLEAAAAERSLEVGGELGTGLAPAELAPADLAGTLGGGTGELSGLGAAPTLTPVLPEGTPILERGALAGAAAAEEPRRAARAPVLARAGGWRRAVIAAELLAPPLALRAGIPGAPANGAFP